MLRTQLIPRSLIAKVSPVAKFSHAARVRAKNDSSTIDSFRLPSQTSINEWEFKYDFMPKVSEPKIPPVHPEAIKQDIAQNKKEQVENVLLTQELNSSIKVEANDATVVHGGETVGAEPEYIHDAGSPPVDMSKTGARKTPGTGKTANTAKYMQSSANPEINHASVVNLGDHERVAHKTATVETPSEVHDAEDHGADMHAAEGAKPSKSPAGAMKMVAVLALGGFVGSWLFSKKSDKKLAK